MPQRQVRIHPLAAAEADAAATWYIERSTLAAQGFVAELDLVIARVLTAPERWPAYELGTRRYVFPRYPFSLIYRLFDDYIEVIAIAHHSRRPGYWKRRARIR